MNPRTRSLARHALLVMACVFVSHSVAAQGFWATKPFNQWSDDEVKKLLSDSPWAKKVEVVRSTGPETSDFLSLTLTWENALPVRQASVRVKMGKPGDVPAEAKAVLEATPDGYTIRLAGLPADMVQAISGNPQAPAGSVLKVGKREIPLKGWAAAPAAAPARGAARATGSGGDTPTPDGADAAPAAGGGGRGGGGGGRGGAAAGGGGGGRAARSAGRDFLMMFPMDTPITLQEGDQVEVLLKFDKLKISKVFKLKDMVVGGKLVM